MSYTLPAVSNQKLTNLKKACIINAKINGGENVRVALDPYFFYKILIDGQEVELPTEGEDQGKITLEEGSHDVLYHIKPWDENDEYKGEYVLSGYHFSSVPLTYITIPNNVVCIKLGTFGGNNFYGELETIEVPDNVKTIEDGAFYGFQGSMIIHTIDKHKIGGGLAGGFSLNNLTFIGEGDIVVVNNGGRTPINGNLTFDKQNVTFDGVFGTVNGEEINFGQGNITFLSSSGGCFSLSSTLKRIKFGNGNITIISSGSRFNNNTALEEITFGDGNIVLGGSGDFSSNSSLRKINFGNKGTLTFLLGGGGTFYNNSSLEEVIFPNDLTEFYCSNNFNNNQNLTSIKIPVLKIMYNGLILNFSVPTDLEIGTLNTIDASNNLINNIKNLVIHNGTIGKNAFMYNPLQSLILGNGVTEIGEGAFKYTNYYLNGYECTMGNNVTKLGRLAFYYAGCTKVKLSNSLKEIPEECFYDSWLTELEIPSSVEVIKLRAFYHSSYSSINKLTLHNGLKRVEEYSFYCNPITDLVIPETVEYIGNYAFANSSNGYYLTNLTINMKQGRIDNYAFAYNYKLRNLVINPGVEELGVGAFSNAYDLMNLHIPGTVKKIEQYCFLLLGYSYTTNYEYKTLELDEGIEEIESSAFSSATITNTLVLPNSIKYLGDSNPLPNVANNAKIITFNPNPPLTNNNYIIICVPYCLRNKYQQAGYRSVYTF